MVAAAVQATPRRAGIRAAGHDGALRPLLLLLLRAALKGAGALGRAL